MTVLSPCRRCARKGDCSKLADLRQKLRGAGVTKATVKCDIPKADFPIGQPVMVRTFDIVEDDDGYSSVPQRVAVKVSRQGVVQRHRAGKIIILLDVGEEVGMVEEDDRPLSILGVYHDQLSLIEGMKVPVDLCACGLTEDRCQDEKLLPQLRRGAWICREERADG